MNSKSKKKQNSVKFILQPRPQRDPLAADYDAPQHVLVPASTKDAERAKKEFDPTLFESEEHTRTGMLERAHEKAGMTFDSDLLEAMSKDFNYEDPNNVLDDDFLNQAGGLIEEAGEMLDGEVSDLTKELFEQEPEVLIFNDGDENEDADADSDDYDIDQAEVDEIKSGDIFGQGRRLILFKKKATKKLDEKLGPMDDDDNRSAVFTNYSMTSSVMRRNQGLQQLDEHFERMYEKEYADDTEIGALDLNDVGGEKLLTDTSQIQDMKQEVKEVRKRNHGDDYQPEIVSDHHKNAIIGDDCDEEGEDLVEIEVTKRENRVDCESILSYSSNLYNHPKLIVEPRRKKASSSASDLMDAEFDTRSRSDISRSIASTRATVLSKLSIRPANETSEERRARKKALKSYRHERRQERKQNQQIFKSEQANVMRQQRNNRPALKLA